MQKDATPLFEKLNYDRKFDPLIRQVCWSLFFKKEKKNTEIVKIIFKKLIWVVLLPTAHWVCDAVPHHGSRTGLRSRGL